MANVVLLSGGRCAQVILLKFSLQCDILCFRNNIMTKHFYNNVKNDNFGFNIHPDLLFYPIDKKKKIKLQK